MANEKNLVLFTSDQSREEARKNGAKGGKKSGEARRKRKAMKEQMELLLSLPLNIKDKAGNDIADMLSTLGIEKGEIDNQMALIVALWKTAMTGGNNQVSAFQEIRKIVQDEQSVSEDDRVQDEQSVSEDDRVQIINDLPRDDEDD